MIFFEIALKRVSIINDDFPPPETTVMLIKLFKGKLISIFFRLFPDAEVILMKFLKFIFHHPTRKTI